jgi:hypothetical protein
MGNGEEHGTSGRTAVLVLTLDLLLVRVDERVVVAELEEALDTGGRVLGTLAVIACASRQPELAMCLERAHRGAGT